MRGGGIEPFVMDKKSFQQTVLLLLAVARMVFDNNGKSQYFKQAWMITVEVDSIGAPEDGRQY